MASSVTTSELKRYRYPLAGKIFYLDCAKGEKEVLDPKIEFLGGETREDLKSEDITHIVTKDWKRRKNSLKVNPRVVPYPFDKFSQFLMNRCDQLEEPVVVEGPTPSPEELVPFLKLTCPGHNKPHMIQFPNDENGYSTVPQIRVNSPPGHSPFLSEADCIRINTFMESKENKTGKRKTSTISKKEDIGGYCENCLVRFKTYYEHIRTEAHINFERNDSNFVEMDKFLASINSCIQ